MLAPPVRTVAVIDDDRRVLMSLANLLASMYSLTRSRVRAVRSRA